MFLQIDLCWADIWDWMRMYKNGPKVCLSVRHTQHILQDINVSSVGLDLLWNGENVQIKPFNINQKPKPRVQKNKRWKENFLKQ